MTDGIRVLAVGFNGRDADVTETFEPRDDGATETGDEMEMTSEKDWSDPCPPGSACPACATEREQAIRLAREALDRTKALLDDVRREYDEKFLAVLELTGETPLYAACLRARLDNDEAALRRAKVEFYADDFLRSSTPPPAELADAVTVRVAEMRLAEQH